MNRAGLAVHVIEQEIQSLDLAAMNLPFFLIILLIQIIEPFISIKTLNDYLMNGRRA